MHRTTEVCTNCFSAKNKCSCGKWNKDYCYRIDNKMINIIKNFNENGYKTIGCCEGDVEYYKDKRSYNGFVSFYGKQELSFPKNTILKFCKSNNKKYKNCWTLILDKDNLEAEQLSDKELKKRFLKELEYVSENSK